MPKREKISVENVNVPGYTHNVDAVMYNAMLQALLQALPAEPPGLTQAEMIAAVIPYLPEELFPGGAKAGWWMKTVQLDQEAKGTIVREKGVPRGVPLGTPTRWRRA